MEQKSVMPIVLKNGIIVAGHPRSGTSLVCKLVESSGVEFPSDIQADDYNKDGYFELSSAKELEKKLIKEAMSDSNILEMNKVVSVLNSPGALKGLKIVHIPAIFFYKHIAKNIRSVFIFRNPAEVKASMYKRGISSFGLSWYENNNALIAAHENISKSIVVSYESLIKGKPEVIRAFRKIGLNIDLGVVKKGHQTQKDSMLCLTKEEERMYRVLKSLEKKSFKKERI